MTHYYTATNRDGSRIHLVQAEDVREDLYVTALCPAAVKRTAVRKIDSPALSGFGGLREVEEWETLYPERLCSHCRRMASCDGARVHA